MLSAWAAIVSHAGLLRVGEALSLHHENIQICGSRAIINIKKAKTGRNQPVLVEDSHVVNLLKKLKQWAEQRGTASGDGRLFPITYDSLRRRFRQALACLNLDISRYTWHSLRHGGATRLALNDVPLEIIAVRGRWKALANAVRYIQLGESLLTEIRMSAAWVRKGEELVKTWFDLFG